MRFDTTAFAILYEKKSLTKNNIISVVVRGVVYI